MFLNVIFAVEVVQSFEPPPLLSSCHINNTTALIKRRMQQQLNVNFHSAGCVIELRTVTYRSVQPSSAVHCDKQLTPHSEQADHSSVNGGDLY